MYQDIEAERCLISAMIDSESALIECCAALGHEDFTDKRHITLFDTLRTLYQKALRPTFLEICKEAQKAGPLSKEDREYLEQTICYHVSLANLSFWLENVKDKSNRRKLKMALMQIAEDLKNESIPTNELLNATQQRIMNITASTADVVDTGAELSAYAKQVIQDRIEHKGELQGIPTGIKKLDRFTAGWKPGDLVLLTAESGKGKTAFCQNFIAQGCFLHEVPTLYVNSEMSKKQVVMRFASLLSEVNANRIKFGEIEQHEKERIDKCLSFMELAPFYHYFSPDLSLNKVIRVIRKYFVQKDIKIVFIDYVGRMEKIDKNLHEWQVLEGICKTLKTIAQELNIVVIVLAQLNDDKTLQAAKRMRNEADIMIKILPMSKEDMEEAKGQHYKKDPNYWLYLDKNRDGQGEALIPVLFRKETLQVVDVV